MAYSLVGSAGAVTIGAAGAAVTPAWGTGESRTAGNLLVLLVGGWGNASFITFPDTWLGSQTADSVALTGALCYKIATGSDAAPTIAAATGMTWGAQLLEFSGNTTPADPLEWQGSNSSSSTSPVPIPTQGTDAAAGNLVAWAVVEGVAVITATMASSLNHGMTAANDVQNNSTSTANHYLFGWGITAGTSGVADSNTVTWDVGAGDSVLGLIKSFTAMPPSPQSNLRATMRARRY